jgi:transcriptional regulator with XRE-family HTH domain
MALTLKEIVAANVKRVRLLTGLTQAELAKRSKLSEVYISRIENSANNLTLDSIEQIAAALGVPALQLFEGSKAGSGKFARANVKAIRQALKALEAFLDQMEGER